MNLIYKANDVRGRYPSELNEGEVRKIGLALGEYFRLKTKTSNLKPVLIIGHDARLSSPSLYRTLKSSLKVEGVKLSGAKSAFGGLKVVEAGIMTTPMLYFLVNDLDADGGIMITASHNPKEYNGLKVVKKGARPIGGKQIEDLFFENL